jgi:hypothetical protein
MKDLMTVMRCGREMQIMRRNIRRGRQMRLD